jgi:hypothetical protein
MLLLCSVAALALQSRATPQDRVQARAEPPASASAGQHKATPEAVANADTARLLQALLPNASATTRANAIREIRKRKASEFVAPLIDLLRFETSRDEDQELQETLHKLTGEKADEEDSAWDQFVRWFMWYGAQSQFPPPAGYTGWKGELYAGLVDPRFRMFLYDGAQATMRVEEVVWGGVRVDGIPALVNPRMQKATEATELGDAEPVFGVSIRGDNRAYPLRIMDWHEMSNDVVSVEQTDVRQTDQYAVESNDGRTGNREIGGARNQAEDFADCTDVLGRVEAGAPGYESARFSHGV